MQFEGDAFISYAHLDNVELVEGRKGWVANLHRALEVRVGQLLGKSPHIWRDPKLSGNDVLAETLIDQLRQVALLVSVVSPRYLKSEWTLRELNEFWSAAQRRGGVLINNKARIFKVLKTPVPLERTPPELQTLIGYEFFKVDPESGKVRELDEVFGADAQRDFWLKLDDLAHDIVALLEVLQNSEETPATAPTGAVSRAPLRGGTEDLPPGAAAAAPSHSLTAPAATQAGSKKEAVYLAETTSDLREEREAIKRDLKQQGISRPARPHDPARVRRSDGRHRRGPRAVPHVDPFHRTELQPGARRRLRVDGRDAARAGDDPGSRGRLRASPLGAKGSEGGRSAAAAGHPAAPHGSAGPGKCRSARDLLRGHAHDDAGLAEEGPDAARSARCGARSRAARATPVLYLMADQRDAALLIPWIDALFAQRLEVVQPIFEGDEAEIRGYHEENLAYCDGALILYGAGNELWVRRKLREIQKSAGYGRTKPPSPVAICLVGARTPEKERFRTHEATVVPGWDGVPLEKLGAFIARLKDRESV